MGENSVLSSHEDMCKLLEKLPSAAVDIGDALETSPLDQAEESDSIAQLRRIISECPVRTLAVVCHYWVIHGLTGVDTDNADVVECLCGQDGQLKVIHHHVAPYNEG